MPSLNSRNRIVVFRLTQDEYNSLKSACIAAGGRNLSDYTRSELLTLVQSGSLGAIVQRRFFEIDRKLTDLHDLIKHVSERFASEEPIPTEEINATGRHA